MFNNSVSTVRLRLSRSVLRSLLIAVIPALFLGLVGSAFVQRSRQSVGTPKGNPAKPSGPKSPSSVGAVQTTPTPPTLTKEYIYFGGQLVATAEPLKFADVTPSDTYYADILKIAQAEVTLGNGAGYYTPNNIVTREQMAAFITRAMGYHNPPQPSSQRFTDVPSTSPFYAAIEQLYQTQVTLGCGSGATFCPQDNVTHEQMAAFMVRACGGFNPPTPSSQRFPDVPPSNSFYAFIEMYAAKGVWQSGCDPISSVNFCPSNTVTRAQMARILVNNFNLAAIMDYSKLTDGNPLTHPRPCNWAP